MTDRSLINRQCHGNVCRVPRRHNGDHSPFRCPTWLPTCDVFAREASTQRVNGRLDSGRRRRSRFHLRCAPLEENWTQRSRIPNDSRHRRALLLIVAVWPWRRWHARHRARQVSAQRGNEVVANLWVGVGGSGSCVRSAVPVGYAAAVAGGNVCDSGPTAYVRAQLGDTVLIEGGTYTSQWNFTAAISKAGTAGTCDYNYPGTPNLSGCVTLQAGVGAERDLPGGAVRIVSQIRVCANFVSIQNVTISDDRPTPTSIGDTVSNGSIAVGAGDTSCLPDGAPPHDLYFANNNYGGQAGAVGGASNVWFVGGTATGTSGLPLADGRPGQQRRDQLRQPQRHRRHDLPGLQLRQQRLGSPPHGMHARTTPATHITIADNRFKGCPVYSFRFEAEGPTPGNSQTNHLIENNYFDGDPLNFDCHDPGCVNHGNTVRFNSFNAASFAPTNDCALTTPATPAPSQTTTSTPM